MHFGLPVDGCVMVDDTTTNKWFIKCLQYGLTEMKEKIFFALA